jgi:endogenous inhibitor of DNA gyrase (YacG/DUF329 family)
MADLGRWLRGDYRIAGGTPSAAVDDDDRTAENAAALEPQDR